MKRTSIITVFVALAACAAAYVPRAGRAGCIARNYEQVGEFFSYYFFDRHMKLVTAFTS